MTWKLGPIWVGTDFSEAANLAVQRAAGLAREHAQVLHLLHALDEGDWLARVMNLMHGELDQTSISKAAGSRLADLSRQLMAEGVAAVDYHLEMGSLGTALHSLAKEGRGNLFVMGARGEDSFREAMLGSTADRVLRNGTLPVLLCRRDAAPWRRVVLATDFSTAAAGACRLGLSLAPGANHYLFHASEPVLDRGLAFANAGPEVRDAYHRESWGKVALDMNAFAGELGARESHVIMAPRQGHPARVLASFVDEMEADLVVLGARPRARWEANLLGSTALFASSRLGCDVLLVPQQA